MKNERYVIVDRRQVVGNSVMFWCWDGAGYTCDLSKAGIFTEEEARNRCSFTRPTDVMFKYSDVLKLVQHHVDVQDLLQKEIPLFPHTYSHLGVRG